LLPVQLAPGFVQWAEDMKIVETDYGDPSGHRIVTGRRG
jgi:hypothetical protein